MKMRRRDRLPEQQQYRRDRGGSAHQVRIEAQTYRG